MMAAMLTTGAVAPPFRLPDQDGEAVSLEELRGSWVLLWWYPKAATPG
jgi:peroxiredoxin Q/BCP